MTLDFSTDYLVWDNREAVTLTSVTNDGEPETSVAQACRCPITQKEVQASNGAYVSQDLHWLLPGVLLGSVVPKSRDRIEDSDATTWTIIDYSYDELTQVYDCVSRDLIIVNGLSDTITIEIPTVTQGDAMERVNDWIPLYVDIACKVQPDTTDVYEERGKKATVTTYKIFLSEEIDPRNDAGDWGRVIWNDNILPITRYTQAERIDELPLIECTLDP